MSGPVLHAAGELEYLILSEGRVREYPGHPGPPDRERPGLVEDGDADLAELLERGAMAEDDPAPRRAIDAPDHRDRRREDQRAWRRHDQDGEHPDGVAGQEIGSGADGEGERGEPDGIAVGEPLEGRLALLGGADQLHDPGVLALAGRSRCANRERTLEVEAAAEQPDAGLGAYGTGSPVSREASTWDRPSSTKRRRPAARPGARRDRRPPSPLDRHIVHFAPPSGEPTGRGCFQLSHRLGSPPWA